MTKNYNVYSEMKKSRNISYFSACFGSLLFRKNPKNTQMGKEKCCEDFPQHNFLFFLLLEWYYFSKKIKNIFSFFCLLFISVLAVWSCNPVILIFILNILKNPNKLHFNSKYTNNKNCFHDQYIWEQSVQYFVTSKHKSWKFKFFVTI